MIEAVLHSLTAVTVLVLVASVGWLTAKKGWYDDRGRTMMARLVNLALPFFLFYLIYGFLNMEPLNYIRTALFLGLWS